MKSIISLALVALLSSCYVNDVDHRCSKQDYDCMERATAFGSKIYAKEVIDSAEDRCSRFRINGQTEKKLACDRELFSMLVALAESGDAGSRKVLIDIFSTSESQFERYRAEYWKSK